MNDGALKTIVCTRHSCSLVEVRVRTSGPGSSKALNLDPSKGSGSAICMNLDPNIGSGPCVNLVHGVHEPDHGQSTCAPPLNFSCARRRPHAPVTGGVRLRRSTPRHTTLFLHAHASSPFTLYACFTPVTYLLYITIP